jgi:hypothetical protein
MKKSNHQPHTKQSKAKEKSLDFWSYVITCYFCNLNGTRGSHIDLMWLNRRSLAATAHKKNPFLSILPVKI